MLMLFFLLFLSDLIAVLTISSLFSFSLLFLSYPFFVEFHYLRAFTLIPERTVLRRNCGVACGAVEAVAIWAFVGVKSVNMVWSLI
jgi:hypothetical protein